MFDDILAMNIRKLALSDGLLPAQSHVKVSEDRQLSGSASSFFFPSSQLSSSSLSLSTEHVNTSESESSLMSPNVWSHAPVSSQKEPSFRPDRSISLTESSSDLVSFFEQLKTRELFPRCPSSTVAPPPGFPPSSNLPPQVQPMLLSNRYKTELCRGFQETGSCKYGSKCQFAHGEAELRGLYRHPKYKTEPCRTFYNFGYCPYGPRCHFIHEEKIAGAPLTSSKFQRKPIPSSSCGHNPRHQLRQSLSFAGFMGSLRSSSPPSLSSTFNDVNLAFSRAPSVSPPPDPLSPVFGDSVHREATAFQFDNRQFGTSAGDMHSIPLAPEPKVSRSNSSLMFTSMEDGPHQDSSTLFPSFGDHKGLVKSPGLQRFSSEDSLEDSYSSSSSSGTNSPTFDKSANKRLTVFERLSLSD
ncbi:Zinc finger protein 36, C3H1 type-like 1 [Oryzias melastigma]|uniref:mRNA decay activator protein ZFP36 n=1 Tax=Oryzias melastigma TaxID=30732 RepID=A0A834FLL7_ORYME|nr:Zinc finger protein 36, C3H1 type-like 1 [Oryzias melastigma]